MQAEIMLLWREGPPHCVHDPLENLMKAMKLFPRKIDMYLKTCIIFQRP